MSDDFMGVGFAFGASDVGFDAAIDSAASNLGQINGMMDDQNDSVKESTSLWKKMSGAYRKTADSMVGFATKFNIASMAGNIRDLTGETGNLTNGLEAMGVANAKAVKPILAGMDLTSNEMRKMTSQASGMAIALNTDATSIANTMKAIETAGAPAKGVLDEMNMSTKDWQKTIETTGVDMQDYVAVMGDMTASWGASNKQSGDMIDNIVAIGKKAKVGTAPIKGMKGQLDSIDLIFEKLPPNMARSSDEIQTLMESTYKAAGAFKEMGETEEGAVSMAQDTAKMFAEQAVMIEKLYAVGGEGKLDESPMFKFLTQLGTGTEEARDIIKEGSVDVVGGMQKINDLFTKFGGNTSPQVQHALAGLSGALGDGAAGLGYLAQSADTGKDSLAAMSKMVVDGDGALKKFGNSAYSSGRTLQETYDLAKESFDTTIRSIARQDVQGYVGLQIKGMKAAGKEIKALGGDETWGPWVNAVSNFRQMGVGGLFASFADKRGGKEAVQNASKMSAKFNLVFDTAKQLGGEMAPVMELLGMAGPLGPLLGVGGLAGLLFMKKEDQDAILGSFGDTFRGIVTTAKEKFKEMIDSDVIYKIGGSILKAFEWVRDAIDWKAMFINVGAFLGQVVDVLVKDIPWEALASKAVEVVSKVVPRVLSGIADSLGEGGALGVAMIGAGTLLGGGAIGMMSGPLGMAALAVIFAKSMWDESERLANENMDKSLDISSKITPDKLTGYSDENLDKMIKIQRNLANTKPVTLFGWDPNAEEHARGKGASERLLKKLQAEKNKRDNGFYENKLDDADFAGLPSQIGGTGFMGGMSVEKASGAGYGLAVETGKGYLEGAPEAIADIKKGQDEIAKYTGQSLPTEGPLKEGIGAFGGGYETMLMFSSGILEGTEAVRLAVEQVMNDSVLLTMEEYSAKIKESAESKSLMSGIAKSIVRDFGGSIETTVDVAGEPENVKAAFEAALSVPGLAGVTLAIIQEGAKTRRVLGRILLESEKQTNARGGSGDQPTLPN